ncbi:NAD(P)H-hydrate dehydratase [Colwellia sp. MEBiC06753]
MEVIQLAESLPQPVYSANQVLTHEAQAAKQCGIELFELMKRAGAGAFNVINSMVDPNSSILIIVGKGNNGGDGFIVAQHCLVVGMTVKVLVLTEQQNIVGDAKRALEQLQTQHCTLIYQPDLAQAQHHIEQFEGDVIVDAIFGIGFHGELSEPWQQVITAVNRHYAQVVSIDIPSGLCASTGAVSTIAVIANITITFIVLKQGLLTGKAANHVGKIYLASLGVQDAFIKGIPATIFAQGERGLPSITPRLATYHKGSIGLVLAIGGNIGMPGAIRLAAESALRAGASLLAVSCHQDNHGLVFQGRPEIMLAPSEPERLANSSFIDKAKVVLVGPGLAGDSWAKKMVDVAITANRPLVVDADALALIKHKKVRYSHWVLTPHPGEAAFLLDTDIASIEADRFAAVQAIVERYGGVCVLKGAGSLIAANQQILINTTGNAGMASGGMGDVLSGIIAALILQTGSIFEATRLAVSIHGQAAELVTQQVGMRGLLASDLFEPIRQLVNRY